jgi:hypothetical protein
MPETQIRRRDGSNTTIPELLQELAAKEAAESNSYADGEARDRRRGITAAPHERALPRSEPPQR